MYGNAIRAARVRLRSISGRLVAQNSFSCRGRIPLCGPTSVCGRGIRDGEQEQIWAAQPDHFRDAPLLPVLHSLHATSLRVEPQLACDFGGAAKAVDEFCVRVMVGHGWH